MKNVGIVSVGKYVPRQVLDNHQLEQMVETSDDWITARTGIKERRIATKHERTSLLAVRAARDAIRRSNISPSKIELIIVGTISPDSPFPSVACLVQKAIHAENAAAFDVSAACSGFLFALTTAKQYVQNGMFKNALVISAEKITNFIDWNDRGTCVLFGDGAGACVIAPVTGKRGILSDYIHSQGQYGYFMQVVTEEREPLNQTKDTIKIPRIVMQGQELFKIAVNSMAEAVLVAVKRAKLKVEDIDCVVPHQANDRIISAVARKLKIPKEKFFINIDKYGNTSGAAIAIALFEAVEARRIRRGDHVALVTFGAGLVTAANVVRW